ncbi:hypothetical protein CR513_10842, partial [Mucuna pruriens]
MDILGPFPMAKGQVKFLCVGVDYFTKWIEEKPLATMTTQKVQRFIWKNIICRYRIPNSVANFDDGSEELRDYRLSNYLASYGVTIAPHSPPQERPLIN